jgi:glutathione S-transferase
VLSESETINEYLNDAWPEPPLLPAVAPVLAAQAAATDAWLRGKGAL